MVPKVIGIHKLAELLNCSTASIYSHIARKNWDAIPTPIRMGKRLAWLQANVDEWFAHKVTLATNESTQKTALQWEPKKQGRPTKTESRNKRKLLTQFSQQRGE